MGVNWKALVGTLAVSTAFAVFVPLAHAQEEEVEVIEVDDVEIDIVRPAFYGTPAEAMERAFFQDGNDLIESVTFGQQIRGIFGVGISAGLGAFPENQMLQDSRTVELVYRDALRQQSQSDPTIRVPDLANPFNTSLMLLPSSQSGGRVVGTEFIFERRP
ncbi:MAG: hypothetical protein AAGF24_12580 [Cyanobacteria bacterium P01_H01_bin.121]